MISKKDDFMDIKEDIASDLRLGGGFRRECLFPLQFITDRVSADVTVGVKIFEFRNSAHLFKVDQSFVQKHDVVSCPSTLFNSFCRARVVLHHLLYIGCA